jgi:hypothetical protein
MSDEILTGPTLPAAGTAVWRLKYHLSGKEGLYSIGAYPGVSLEDARHARLDAKAHLREGRDPVQARPIDRVAAGAPRLRYSACKARTGST